MEQNVLIYQDENTTVKKFFTVQVAGEREAKRNMEHYNKELNSNNRKSVGDGNDKT